MIGRKEGKLTIIEFSHIKNTNSGKRQKIWKTKCDCGNERLISTAEFNRKRTPVLSCGCYKYFEDLIGNKFNDLTVISLSHKKGKQYYWLCKCDCGNEKIIRGESLTRKIQKTCGCLITPSLDIYKEKARKRLLSNIEKKDNGCWEWIGYLKPTGYGHIAAVRLGIQSTHRLSYLLFKGDIPPDLYVCHHCDNKKCCNPDHLYLGTPLDNARDAKERGLLAVGKNPKKGFIGSKHPLTKLDEDKVKYIRFLCENGFKKSEICSFFNIKSDVVKKIASRKTWKQI